MKERYEKTTDPVNKLANINAPYTAANYAIRIIVISSGVAVVKQPCEWMLNLVQQPGKSPSVSKNTVFRGMYSGIISSHQRGAVALTNKEVNRAVEKEEIEVTTNQRYLGTLFFSQLDIALSSASSAKSRLELAGVVNEANFKWSFQNYRALTTVNWGSRSVSAFTNFAFIGFAGDYLSSLYKFNNELSNKFAGGATAGVLATVLTTIPNSYGDRKLLASKMENNRLLTTSAYTMFSQMKSEASKLGPKAAITLSTSNFLKEILIRAPQSALTFGLILTLDHLLGTEPLKNVWPNGSPKIEAEKSTIASPTR